MGFQPLTGCSPQSLAGTIRQTRISAGQPCGHAPVAWRTQHALGRW